MRFKMTQGDIDGFKSNIFRSRCCPIANCLRRLTGERVSVSANMATIGTDIYKLDEDAQNFINEFDSGLEVEPIEFEIT